MKGVGHRTPFAFAAASSLNLIPLFFCGGKNGGTKWPARRKDIYHCSITWQRVSRQMSIFSAVLTSLISRDALSNAKRCSGTKGSEAFIKAKWILRDEIYTYEGHVSARHTFSVRAFGTNVSNIPNGHISFTMAEVSNNSFQCGAGSGPALSSPGG